MLNKDTETKEVRLDRENPGFNLVALKARHRLNQFQKTLSRSDYRDYIRKCKNMYSISSQMNHQNSMLDLYNKEKSSIGIIKQTFTKIDEQLSGGHKIRLTIKKSASQKEEEKNKTNFTQKKMNMTVRGKENLLYTSNSSIKGKNKKFTITGFSYPSHTSRKNQTIDVFQNLEKINEFNIDGNRNEKEIKIIDNNNDLLLSNEDEKKSLLPKLSKTFCSLSNTYKFSKTKKKYHSKSIIEENNNEREFFENNNNKMNKIYPPENLKKEKNDSCFILNKGLLPMSQKNINAIDITRSGAVCYKRSIFRNRSINYFLPKYYNLPLIHSIDLKKMKINE